jgi:AcrR family transcriptional regulator
MTGARIGPSRRGYRHGNRRRALLEAGIALARRGGPDVVVLREATRQAGVAPNAAYGQIAGRQGLLEAVHHAALAALALAMERELARLRPTGLPGDDARAALRAVGRAYLRFAQRETGLFRTAFALADPTEGAGDPDMAGKSGLNPFQLLARALDQLVAAGALAPARRPGAEYIAWSAVHGLAMLLVEGPLRRLKSAERRAIGERLLKMVEKGL